MIPLSSKIRKNGFEYTLLCRGGRSCLYAQHITPDIVCFEVFVIRIQKDAILFGKKLPDKELFPRDEDFGKTAWSFSDYDLALQKFQDLESQSK
jgi:hypothetical protein